MRLTVLLVAALLTGTNPALAAERTVTVSGDSVPSNCGAAKSPTASTDLTGSLVGCLAIFTQHFNCHEMTGFAFSRELGREEFEGTLDGRAIKFDTTYTFDAIWPTGSCPAPTPESEVAGGCTHYVSGEGVDGIIRFYDIIPTVGKGATNFLYEGVLTVSDQTSVAATPVVAPRVDVAAVELPSAPHAPRSC
jgi:hypothetical protein